MYPFERYYKGLKSLVRNLAKPEGSMSVGYELEDGTGYLTEYMKDYSATYTRVWDSEEDPTITDEILEGCEIPRTLTEVQRTLSQFCN